ncbi:unnamed protein product, partial [Symbiodinium sp. CCMP2456]
QDVLGAPGEVYEIWVPRIQKFCSQCEQGRPDQDHSLLRGARRGIFPAETKSDGREVWEEGDVWLTGEDYCQRHCGGALGVAGVVHAHVHSSVGRPRWLG